MQALNRLNISTKIMAGIPLLAFPTLMMGYFLVVEKQGLIDFTSKEIAGVQYLRATQEALHAATAPAFDAAAFAKAADALTEAEKNDGGALGVTDKSVALADMLRKAGPGADAAAITGATTDLISSISDNSNITLDPDADSYFIGDIVVNQTTGVVTQIKNLLDAAPNATASDEGKIAYAKARDGMAASAGNIAAELGKGFKGNADGSLKEALEADGTAIAAAVQKVVDAANAYKPEVLTRAAGELKEAMNAFTSKNSEQLERLLNVRNAGFRQTLIERLLTALATLVIGVFVFVIVARSIVRPLKNMVGMVDRLSTGDYSAEVEGAVRGDEIGQMAKALNTNVQKIRETVVRIKESAVSVNSAAGEIAAGSSDLSMRTEQQASNLEETAASMEEITGTVKQNSSSAVTANDLSIKANQVASAGGKVVEEAVTAMGNIENSSKKISDIISVIDEIAFQTNLLALNAAVEAARAGDAGKGFAVVASEVRSLAGRSASASKEIKALINESVQQVQSGAQLVNQAGETLRGIVDSVKQVAGIVSDIASASQQQATGIDEINTAVAQMDEMTQQNAALVEENTAAAQSMLEQAKSLEGLISFFNLGDAETEAAAKPTLAVQNTRPTPKSAPKPALKRPALKTASIAASPKQDSWEEF